MQSFKDKSLVERINWDCFYSIIKVILRWRVKAFFYCICCFSLLYYALILVNFILYLYFLKTSVQLRRFQLFITYILTGSVSRQEVFHEKCVLKISEMFTRLEKFHILQWLYAKVVLKKDKVLVKGDPKINESKGIPSSNMRSILLYPGTWEQAVYRFLSVKTQLKGN